MANSTKKRKKEIPGSRPGIIDRIATVAKIVIIVILVLFMISKGKEAYNLGYSVFNPSSVDAIGQGHEVTVTVTESMGESDIADLLVRNGLIENALVFRVQLKFSDYSGMLQPGTYTLSTEMLPTEIMAAMAGDGTEETTSQ